MKADPSPADEATSYAIRFPDDPEIFSQTEAQQLVAEELVEKWEKGKMRLLWDNKKRRNEALDCLVYAYAALRVSVQRWQLDLAVLAKSREEETTRPTLKELAAKLSGGVNGYVAELQALRQARLDLLTGKRVVSVQKDGRRIEYTVASLDDLNRAINDAESVLGTTSRRRRPLGVRL
ncbi:gpW family protein [Escherichia coli DEC10F]|nr:gpW family protein [Escherichia coli DEC10F]